MTSAKDTYRVEAVDAQGAGEAVVRVWAEGDLGGTAGTSTDRLRFSWFYLANPVGVALLYLLFTADEILPIGALGIGRREFYAGVQKIQAGALVDYVVAPRHRSVYPALLLQRKGREQAQRSIEVLYGLPDTKAVAICKRLETHVNLELRRYARVIRTRPYLERILPKWVAAPLSLLTDGFDSIDVWARTHLAAIRGRWVSGFDATFDRLWNSINKQYLVIGVRDSKFLQWRFNQQPGHAYRTFAVTRARQDELVAYFVCEQVGKTLSIKDVLCHGSERELVQGLLALIAEARAMGMTSVDVQLLAKEHTYRALRSAGFTQRSTRPFFAVVPERLRSTVPAEFWYITQADEDV